jgi:hypothetical protein
MKFRSRHLLSWPRLPASPATWGFEASSTVTVLPPRRAPAAAQRRYVANIYRNARSVVEIRAHNSLLKLYECFKNTFSKKLIGVSIRMWIGGCHPQSG